MPPNIPIEGIATAPSTRSDNPLCRFCNNLQRVDPKSLRGLPWRIETKVELLESSANSGCRFCALLLSGIDTCMTTWDREERLSCRVCELENMFESGNAPKGLLLELDLSRKNGHREQIALDFFTLNPDTCPWSSIGVASQICCDTSSDAGFARVVEWMQQCARTHTLCNNHLRRGTPLPKRVVYVGDSSNTQVKLYETQNEIAKYICLSHCWGKAQIIKTVSTTLPSYKKEIPWDELSTTFKHAIIFARKLGIQYIWIDSLCIIQDSDVDWRTESSNMATIYENSYITLAATKSGSGAGGCFSRASPYCKVRELACHDDAGAPHSICVRQNAHHHANFDSVNSNPMLHRGWVFQERILSPRVLHFGEQELLWECLEHATCECTYIEWYKDQRGVGPLFPRFMFGKISHTGKLLSQSTQLLKARWYELVQEYTALGLTFEKDKFPALAGIAKQMQRARGAKYLAGLWEDTLIEDLLWWRHSALPSERPAKWRAPTWSWASIKDIIAYGSKSTYDGSDPIFAYAKILDVQCTPVGPDSTLELASAHLIVSSYIVPVVLRRETFQKGRQYRHLSEIENVGGFSYGFASDFVLPENMMGETVHCLWIARMEGPNRALGLALRCLDPILRIYERIGMASMMLSASGFEGPSSDMPLFSIPATERVTVKIV